MIAILYILLGVVLGVALIAFSVVVFCKRAAKKVLHPKAKRKALFAWPDQFGLSYDNVTFQTEDGVPLKGWWVPGYVTAVTGTYGDTTSVSAARTMQYKKMAAGNGTTWTNATTSINALRGVAFSAFSGGANITATGVGKSNLTLMYHGIDLCNQSNWTTNISANKTITTARAKTITSATFTPVTAMQSNGTIGAYAYCHSSYSQGGRTSYYTGEGRVGGTWTATGIAP